MWYKELRNDCTFCYNFIFIIVIGKYIIIIFSYFSCLSLFKMFSPLPPRYHFSSINWSRVLFNLFGSIIIYTPYRRYCCRGLNQGQLCRGTSVCTHVHCVEGTVLLWLLLQPERDRCVRVDILARVMTNNNNNDPKYYCPRNLILAVYSNFTVTGMLGQRFTDLPRDGWIFILLDHTSGRCENFFLHILWQHDLYTLIFRWIYKSQCGTEI